MSKLKECEPKFSGQSMGATKFMKSTSQNFIVYKPPAGHSLLMAKSEAHFLYTIEYCFCKHTFIQFYHSHYALAMNVFYMLFNGEALQVFTITTVCNSLNFCFLVHVAQT